MVLCVRRQLPAPKLKRRVSTSISDPQREQRRPRLSLAAHSSRFSALNKMSQSWDRFTPSPVTYAIRSGDEFVSIWEGGLKEKVMEVVRETPDWAAVDVVRRGLSLVKATENPITISVTIAGPQPGAAWDVLESKIRVLCSSAGRPDVAVDISQGQVLRWNDTETDDPKPGTALSAPYTTRPEACTSVGVKGGPSGTLGGYVELYRPGEEKTEIAGLTCHHVAFPETKNTMGMCENMFTRRVSAHNSHLPFRRCSRGPSIENDWTGDGFAS